MLASGPRLGFLGAGWIGRSRMEAAARAGACRIGGIADPVPELTRKAGEERPEVPLFSDLEGLLSCDLDGLVIATPSALHAEQSVAALKAGLPVFCQKPLGRNGAETAGVIEAARRADRRLGVDFCYRHLAATDRIRRIIREEGIGRIYAVDLVFHNAYGPDKAWYYDAKQAGGGCVIDLGIHLVDLMLLLLGFPEVISVTSRLFRKGRPLSPKERSDEVEDYATARIDLAGGTVADLACSWGLQAGCDVIIKAAFYGTEGGLCLTNVDGSYYDFAALRYHGTATETLCEPPDDWGPRSLTAWATGLSKTAPFDTAIEPVGAVAEVLDRIYQQT